MYQKKPIFRKPSQFRPKGSTETVEGYLSEARQPTRCILDDRRIMKKAYSWHLTINVEVVQTPKQITDLWTTACRNLRRMGIVALWVREPTRSGKVRYHLILKSMLPEKDVRRIVGESMPDLAKPTPKGKRSGWHMKLQPVTDDWQLAHYVTKAKIAGFVNGKKVEEFYRTSGSSSRRTLT